MADTKDFYNPKENVIDPEDYSVKLYLYDIGKTLTDIKQLLAMLVDEKVNLSNYINDPIAKKEAAMRTIRKG